MTTRILKLTLYALLLLSTSYATSIEETRWGFDNTAVSEQLNLLSVRLFNNTPELFEGAVTLEKNNFQGRVGATHVQPVFVAPYTERWVQFHAYVDNQNGTWNLRVGKGNQPNGTKQLQQPSLKVPARVFLSNSRNKLERPVRMNSFPDDLFPSTVSALDGLFSVVLAHAPEWETPRRQALRDWIYAGGILHVYQNDQGAFPLFLRELDFINEMEGEENFGAGLIVKHEELRKEISEIELRKAGFTLPEQVNAKNNSGATLWQGLNNLMFKHLRKIVLPKHSWPLIFGIAVIYVILIGPVNFVFAQKWKNHFKSIAMFAGCIAVFSLIFSMAGRRGFGESSSIHSLSYVRPLENGFVDLTSWSNVFSTQGKVVSITHNSGNRIYSTCESDEGVPGQIINGPQGMFNLDMPIFSSAQYMLRTRVGGTDLVCKHSEGSITDPEGLAFKLGADFPGAMLEGILVVGNRFYQLEKAGGGLTVRKGSGSRLSRLIDSSTRNLLSNVGNNFGRWGGGSSASDAEQPPEVLHRPLFYGLIERVIQANALYNTGYRLPDRKGGSRARLFVVAESLESYQANTEAFAQPTGYMMLHQDFELK